MSNVIIIIPARYASTRLPGKPLTVIAGKPMIDRVWRIAQSIQGVSAVYVATDHQDICSYVESIGGKVVMTPSECRNGTERCLAAIDQLKISAEIVINLQGDAPITPPWVVQAMVDGMLEDNQADICTPAISLTGATLDQFLREKLVTPSSGTTVVTNLRGQAMYFSKSVIPFARESESREVFRHIGLYAYRTEVLRKIVTLPESPLEKLEKLEQLRALENGYKIKVVQVDYRGRSHASVDTPEDVTRVERIIANEGEFFDYN